VAGRPLIALDIGSSTLRALVGTVPGGVLGMASAPLCYVNTEGSGPLAREFEPDRLFARAGELVAEALEQGQLKGPQVAAIGVTSQRQGSVFLDENGRELYAGPNTDLRAAMEGAVIDEEMGAEVYRVTGRLPSLMFTPARLRWFHRHRPSAYDRMSHVLAIAGWMAYRMTGIMCCEPSLAGEVGLLDVASRERCTGLFERLGIAPSLFPPLVEAGTQVGGLRADVARSWGLPAGTPVTLAGPDTQSGLVGMGAVTPGMTGLVAGWSCSLQTVTAGPRWDEKKRTWVGLMPTKAGWVAESNMGDGGNAYDWLVNTVVCDQDSFERAESMASEAAPGAGGTMAFLGPGPGSMPSAGLRQGGFVFYTPLSFQRVSKGQLLRAALENIAYSARGNLETLGEVTGQDAEAVHLGGGLSRSTTFCTLLANVLGREVHCSVLPEVSTWGALLSAATCAGEYSSLDEAARDGHLRYHAFAPSPADSAEYLEHYQRWRETYHAIQEVA